MSPSVFVQLVVPVGLNLLLLVLIVRIYVSMRRMAARRHVFTLHLRACVRLQLPLDEALGRYGGAPREIRGMLKKTHRALQRGEALSEALSCSWACIPSWYVRMIQVGERHGNLAEVLDRLLAVDSRDEELRMSLVERLLYPVVLCGALGLVGGLMLLFLVPRLDDMMAEMDLPALSADLPLVTVTIGLANILVIGLALLALLACPIPFGPNLERPFSGFFRLKHLLRRFTPYLGNQYLHAACGRWAATTGMLLEVGTRLPAAVIESASIESDPLFRDRAQHWMGGVREGERLSALLEQTGFVPRSLVWQVQLSEGTEALPETLQRVGQQIVRELHQRYYLFLHFVIPFVVLLIGYAVATICIGVFRSIVSISYGCLM